MDIRKTDMPVIDNEFGKLPLHLQTASNVFSFSHIAAEQAAQRFRCGGDMLRALDKTIQTIDQSPLPEEEKNTIRELLEQEKEMISFSHTSRNTVISL
ncbi:hypothetical protein [Brucella intermedia]|uniref:hypothetical protein n=1 Tax=Brucella intermedia TaxID=94625 RepID=UPI00235E0463|nr:hypothetical protein [Brucella intermedia]